MYELLISVIAAVVGVLLQRYHIIPPAQQVQPASGAQPVQGQQPSAQPAAQSQHPIADAVLQGVLSLVMKRRSGATLSTAEHAELATTLPLAQQILAEAAVVSAANPAPK